MYLLAAREPYSQQDLNMMQFLLFDDEEPDERYWFYQKGFFHPVQLGDQLSDRRYTIINKLGNGSFSTVWLAHDEILGRKVAIKIACADAECERGELPTDELEILERLRDNPGSHPGAEVIHPCLDSFMTQGPNGSHRCFVSDPTCINLGQSKFRSEPYWLFRLQVARALVAQLIQGVAFMHSKGIVHGDLHTGNLMLTLPDAELAECSVRDIYAKFDLPKQYPMDICKKASDFDEPIPENAPPYLVGKMYFNDKHAHKLRLSDAKLRIGDFGESWRPAQQDRHELNIPEKFRAPEAMVAEKLGMPIGFPADVWALGCIVIELYATIDLLETYFPGYDEAWGEMIHLLGEPPKAWWDVWKAAADSGDNDDGSSPENKIPRHRDPTSLSDRILQLIDKDRAERVAGIWENGDEDEKVPPGELRDLLSMLEGIFCWLPEDRLKAGDLMHGDWMKNWGLPAIEAMEKAYEEMAKATQDNSASSVSGSESNTTHHDKTGRPVNDPRHGAIRGLFKTAGWGLDTGVWLWLKRALGF
ncbi:protein kinase domain-containing protein [Colletotrichum kahawae]|uniref:Protein kinase domain-containing protein n=1 Tax=Colletotrichum kahawae TaxID=34407 RepID=A0AAD9YNS6_COLKA|nr:protein kinase domain-containing protein [Colletotrichum kahawae]